MLIETCRTGINGLYELRSALHKDSRGSFYNCFRDSDSNFSEIWEERSIRQVNISYSEQCGTIRGLHLQSNPYAEMKIVRCLKGSVWDVAVDLRKDSSTRGHWYSVELRPDLCNALVIPEGFAHGFQTLEPRSELLYIHSQVWMPSAEQGIRYDDPTLAIPWPLEPQCLSDRDLSLPLFEI